MSNILSLVYNGDKWRLRRSPGYNWAFNTNDGTFLRWGETPQDNPKWAPSPEIADIEISTMCGYDCPFCYKGNMSVGTMMQPSFFKNQVLPKFDDNLTQIAFGIGDFEPGEWPLMEIMTHTREQGIIPNITINPKPLSDTSYKFLAETCGSIAVSNYTITGCRSQVEKLAKFGAKQINIHQLLAENTETAAKRLIRQAKEIHGLKSIVFLSLKRKGRGERSRPMSDESFKEVVDLALTEGVSIGMDSCTAPRFLKYASKAFKPEQFKAMVSSVEPCESTLFSIYINVNGEVFPCSFMEGATSEWPVGETALRIDEVNSIKDIWKHPKMSKFRFELVNSTAKCKCEHQDVCRVCPNGKSFGVNCEYKS